MQVSASVKPEAFRAALAQFPSGVTITTTLDDSGQPWGFTASAFCSLSLDPPLLLVCLQTNADCYDAFRSAEKFAASILSARQSEIALRFATKGLNKFDGLATEPGPATGAPLITGACSSLECVAYDRYDGGDHDILIGRVVRAAHRNEEPLLYYDRRFGRFTDQGA